MIKTTTFLKFIYRTSIMEHEGFLGTKFLYFKSRSLKVPINRISLFEEQSGIIYSYVKDLVAGTFEHTKSDTAKPRAKWTAPGIKKKRCVDTGEQRSFLGLQANLYKRELKMTGEEDCDIFRTFQLRTNSLSEEFGQLFTDNKCADYFPFFDDRKDGSKDVPPFIVRDWSEYRGRRQDNFWLESITPVHLEKADLIKIYDQFSER